MRILIRGTNWIGDAVMTIPAMMELRRLFPDAHIALHTRAWAKGIFSDAEYIDEILTFDEQKNGVRTIITEARRLKKYDFDLVVIFPNSYRSAAICKLAGIKKRFGYSKEARRLLLTDPLKVPGWKKEKHEVYYYLNLVSAVSKKMLGADIDIENAAEPLITVSRERIDNARKLLAENGADLGKKLVAIGAGSTNSMAKRWPAENFADLAGKLNRSNVEIILLGSENEQDVSRQVTELSGINTIDLTGRTSLAEAVAILAAVDLFISNDMGLAHVSAAAKTETLVIFGPTDPSTTRAFNANAAVIREPVECSPCMLRECPIDHRCMTKITSKRVFDSAMLSLSKL